MNEDKIRGLLRTLEADRAPDPAFAEALFGRLSLAARTAAPRRSPFLLLAAALLVATLVAALAVGSGLLRLPVVVDASASPQPSASSLALSSASAMPATSASAEPTAAATPRQSAAPIDLAGGILFAEADGLRIRSTPSESGDPVATIRRGQLMGATGETATADGMTWYGVRIGPGDLAGWVAGGPDNAWLRLVQDGAVAFSCSGCVDPTDNPQEQDSVIVSVTPFGDDAVTTVSSDLITHVSWSPDGNYLAGAVPNADGSTIVVMRPDGSERREVGPGGYSPAWSPDGTRLAWTTGDALVVTDGNLTPSELAVSTRSAGNLRWSPDGSLIAFDAIDCPACPPDEPIAGDPPSATWIVGPDGSGARQVTGGDYSGLADWSADGATLSFIQYDLSGEFATRAYLLSVEGGDRRYLLDSAAVTPPPAWSPDGTRLAMATPDGIVVAGGDGSGASLLVPSDGGAFLGDVLWSPSGAWLAYTSSAGPEVTVWIAAVDGSGTRQISPAAAQAGNAAWQPVLVPLP